jgi:hypothetical protein
VEVFLVLGIFSMGIGRTPVSIHTSDLTYHPNWLLNRFLWLPYWGSGDMLWELENLNFLGVSGLILPAILTILWWIFISFVSFSIAFRLYGYIKTRVLKL